jgi:hypothetical protein
MAPAIACRPDVDWLRVLATYLLFVFHAAKVFDVAPFYHVKSPERAAWLDAFTSFVHLWHMPLFFVLAGCSSGCRGRGDGRRRALRRPPSSPDRAEIGER